MMMFVSFSNSKEQVEVCSEQGKKNGQTQKWQEKTCQPFLILCFSAFVTQEIMI